VETAFISNRKEEAKLRRPSHQLKLAKAILNGVKSYLSTQHLPSTPRKQRAKSSYKIKKGDTLSAIAKRYRVSLNSLKKLNAMRNSKIRIGQVIRIPS